MTVSGIQSQSLIDLYDLYGTQSSDSTSASSSTSTSTTDVQSTSLLNRSDSADISKPSELFSKLQQLKASDPEKFKKVCADIAQKLKTAAEGQGPIQKEASRLSDMAQKFQNVADGGDISQLKPPSHAGGHGKRPEGIDAYNQQNQQSLADFLKNDQTKTQSGSGNDMKQIMASIFAEVDDALGN